jgi:hypothetical protein
VFPLRNQPGAPGGVIDGLTLTVRGDGTGVSMREVLAVSSSEPADEVSMRDALAMSSDALAHGVSIREVLSESARSAATAASMRDVLSESPLASSRGPRSNVGAVASSPQSPLADGEGGPDVDRALCSRAIATAPLAMGGTETPVGRGLMSFAPDTELSRGAGG